MRINRLHLRNFRQHEDTELEFGAGLTGIIGPNGAGKTTILEAIAWAMYGMPAARGSRDTIRRRGAGPRDRVEVEMDFTLGAHHFRIVRSLNAAQLYQDGDSAPIANSLGSVSERVTRLLGMSREEFFNTYFTGQKELAVMAAMSAPERAQFLSRVLGYDRIRAAQERLKEKRSALRARLDALRSSLGDPAELEEGETRARERRAAAAAAESATAEVWAGVERRLAELRPRAERLGQLREAALHLETEIRRRGSRGHFAGAAGRWTPAAGRRGRNGRGSAGGGRRAAGTPARHADRGRGARRPGGGARPPAGAGRATRRREELSGVGGGATVPPAGGAGDRDRPPSGPGAADLAYRRGDRRRERQNRVGSRRAGRAHQATGFGQITIRS